MTFRSTTLVTLAVVVTATPALALDATGATGQSSLYFSLAFGGASSGAANLHYGLKFGRASREETLLAPSILSLDFAPGAYAQPTIGGLPLLPQRPQESRLDTGAEAAPKKVVPWYDVTAWGSVQWGLLAGGGILGYVAVSDRHQKAAAATPQPPGATPASPVNACAPGQVPAIGGGCISNIGGGGGFTSRDEARLKIYTREDTSWMDAGTGQMGDLLPQ